MQRVDMQVNVEEILRSCRSEGFVKKIKDRDDLISILSKKDNFKIGYKDHKGVFDIKLYKKYQAWNNFIDDF